VRQFEKVNCSRGAPMGRRSNGYLETSLPRFVRLFRVHIDNGGYEDGGAYWGLGSPLWCAIDGDGNQQFTRASSRTSAAFILDIPHKALKVGLSQGWVNYACDLLDGKAPMPDGKYKGDVYAWMQACGAHMGQAVQP
jgi:hypothetical protein